LQFTPPHGTGMGFEPPEFQRFRPVDVGKAVRTGIAQKLVPLGLQEEPRYGVGSPPVKIASEREGPRGRGFRQSRSSRSRALGTWNM
jgi:hypothetical protein